MINERKNIMESKIKPLSTFSFLLLSLLFEAQADEQTPAAQTPPNDVKNITMTWKQAILRQVMKCYRPPARKSHQKAEPVPIYVNLSKDGYVLKAGLKEGYTPNSDIEKIYVKIALSTVTDPKCQPYPTPKGRFDEEQKIFLNFHIPRY